MTTRTKLTLLLAIIMIIVGACYVMSSKVIDLGAHIDTAHGYQELAEIREENKRQAMAIMELTYSLKGIEPETISILYIEALMGCNRCHGGEG